MRRANVAAALRQLQTPTAAELTHLRLAPERIDATLLTRAGRLRNVQVKPGGRLERFGPDSGPGFDSASTIPFSRLNPGAPQRLAAPRRRAASTSRSRRSSTRSRPCSAATLTWAAYFKRGRYVLGDAPGRFQRKLPLEPLEPAAVVAHAADLLEPPRPPRREREVQRRPGAARRRSTSTPGASPPTQATSRSIPASSSRSSATCSGAK